MTETPIFALILSHHRAFSILAGFLLDILLGDPHWLPHPVRWIGRLISFLEKILRKPETAKVCHSEQNSPNSCHSGRVGKSESPKILRLKGLILAILVIFPVFSVSFGLIFLFGKIHPLARFFLESVICFYCLASRSLFDESMKVWKNLKKSDVEGARRAVSMIVGRDTDILDEKGIARAAVETVAENTSDGVVAPLFFMAFFGAAGGMVYKAINTMDSMIAYKNERYLYLGFFAAKLDDLANFIPARISAILMIFSAFFLRFLQVLSSLFVRGDFRFRPVLAIKIFLRDRYKHASPNSAQTESACAGALGLQLAGDTVYEGIVEKKDFIGDKTREIEAGDIVRANVLMYATTILAVGICLVMG